MSLGILTNVSAIYAQNNLNQTQASLQTTLQQLSSGSRINSGADDAAGLAVASSLGANIAALTQSTQNASNATGLLQTADGALSQVTSLLDRAVTLSTEAASSGLTATQISAANQEYQNILTEIGNIGSTTNFNSGTVFSSVANTFLVSDGTSTGASTFSDTVGALTSGSVGLTTGTSGSAAGTPAALVAGNSVTTVSTATVAAYDTITFGAATNTLSGTLSVTQSTGLNASNTSYAPVSTTFATGTTIAQAVIQLNQQYTNASNGLTATVGGAGTTIIITAPNALTAVSDNVTTGAAGSGVTTLYQSTAGTNATTAAGANFQAAGVSSLTSATAAAVLTTATAAIADVAYQRGLIGANINQLTAASNVAAAESVNLTTSQSSILSTNYGEATSNLAKYEVLSQTGISALAQANTVQQEVLKLLQ